MDQMGMYNGCTHVINAAKLHILHIHLECRVIFYLLTRFDLALREDF